MTREANGQVQRYIDALDSSTRASVISAINESFALVTNSDTAAAVFGFLSEFDQNYIAVLRDVQRTPGENIDFGNRGHREAIGMGLIQSLRGEDSQSTTCNLGTGQSGSCGRGLEIIWN